jgi:exodeoxyribonuclease V beta subunit
MNPLPGGLAPFDPDAPVAAGTTLIEASAGTGKTYNIAEIYVRLLLRLAPTGRGVRDILVVTFTEAATTELCDRIRRRVRDRLDAAEAGVGPPLTDVEHIALRAALGGFDEAAIHTIHGFCQRVLTQFALESGAPADRALLTDDRPLMRDAAQDEFTARTHALPMPVYSALEAVGYTAATVRALAEMQGEGTLVGVPKRPAAGFAVYQARLERAHAAAADLWRTDGAAARAHLIAAADAGRLNKTSYKTDRIVRLFRLLAAYLESGLAPKGLPEALTLLGASTLAEKQPAKAGPPPAHPLFDAIDVLREAFEGLQTGVLDLMHDALERLPEAVARRKQALQALSFGDLLLEVARALDDPERGAGLVAALRARYAWALIDEFQDTDPVQWGIFHAVFERLFLIGDPKQAIYAFRGADLPTYLTARSSAVAQFGLLRNYRTDAALVEKINALFGRAAIHRPFVDPGIEFQTVEARYTEPRLRTGSSDEPGEPGAPAAPLIFRHLLRENAALEKRSGLITATWAQERLPARVAADVVDLLSGPEVIRTGPEDAPSWRPLRPRDVAILVRTNREAAAMKAALAAVGVPAVLNGTGAVFETPEAAELRILMAAMLEPGHLPGLRAALATALLGVEGEVIARFVGSEEDAAFTEWATRFAEWHDLWGRAGFLVAFRSLISRCALLPRWLGEVGGERRVTNLLHLSELVHAAERASALGPHALVAWYDRQRTGESDDDDRQLRLESDADALQIVTMHRSKGLEYGVVFLPSLMGGGKLHRSEALHPRFRLPAAAGERPRRGVYLGGDAALGETAREHAERAVREENVRLAYVALTRARHRAVVYWGALTSAERSPLMHLLHPNPDAAADADPLEAVQGRLALLDDEHITAELSGLGLVVPATLDEVPMRRYEPVSTDPAPLSRRHFPEPHVRPLDRTWGRASFTGLLRRAEHRRSPMDDRPGADETGSPSIAGVSAEGRRVTLAELPSGTGTGLAMHRVLERVPFTATVADLQTAAAPALRYHGLSPEVHGELLARGLAEALDTPLLSEDPACTLRSITAERRVPEMRFDLAVARRAQAAVRPADIAAVLARRPHLSAYAQSVERLGFDAFSGYLGGAIDLCFEHGGRYFVVDFKSNHLGETYADYRPERLAGAMEAGHYHLQAHLYAVAFERHLAARIGPTYDPATHFGGVLYLFVRGMHPDSGPAFGVYRDAPGPEVRAALLRALGVP